MKTFNPANNSPILDYYVPVEERYNINICPAADVVLLYLFIVGVNFPKWYWNISPYGKELRRPSM
jgi:hypothetical protein